MHNFLCTTGGSSRGVAGVLLEGDRKERDLLQLMISDA